MQHDHSDSIKLSIRVVFSLWLRRRQWLRSCNELTELPRGFGFEVPFFPLRGTLLALLRHGRLVWAGVVEMNGCGILLAGVVA